MSEMPYEATPRPGPKRPAAKTAAPKRRAIESRGAKDTSRLKIQIDFPGGARIGPGKISLLEHIDMEGSLSRAAERMGISYRRAWLFMQQINKAFDEVAVSTPMHGHGGGPARLTEFGRALIRHYRSIEQEAARSGAELLRWLDRHKRGGGDQSGPDAG